MWRALLPLLSAGVRSAQRPPTLHSQSNPEESPIAHLPEKLRLNAPRSPAPGAVPPLADARLRRPRRCLLPGPPSPRRSPPPPPPPPDAPRALPPTPTPAPCRPSSARSTPAATSGAPPWSRSSHSRPARPPLATATHGTCSIGASAPVFRDDFPAWRRRMRPSGQTVTRLTGQIVALAAAAPAGPRAPRAALRACPARAARRGGRALGRRAARRRGRDRVAYGAGFRAQRPPQARGRAPRGEPIGGAAAVGPGPRRRARARGARGWNGAAAVSAAAARGGARGCGDTRVPARLRPTPASCGDWADVHLLLPRSAGMRRAGRRRQTRRVAMGDRSRGDG